MKFEIFGTDGERKMYTEHTSCIPFHDINSMSAVGYTFKLDGQLVSKQAIFALETESQSSDSTCTSNTQVRIRCLETGSLYKKQSDAARDLNIDPAQVSDSIKTGRKRSGYTFIKEMIG